VSIAIQFTFHVLPPSVEKRLLELSSRPAVAEASADAKAMA